MNWKATLVRAAEVSQLATNEVHRMSALLDHALAGTLTKGELEAVVGSVAQPRPGYLEAIDAAIRDGFRTEPAFSAARAVLYELPSLLTTMQVAVDDSSVSALLPDRTREVLAHVVQHEQTVLVNEGRGFGARRCPRCGSRQVGEQHTGAVEPRFIEVMCRACGEYANWAEGDEEAATWLAPRDR